MLHVRPSKELRNNYSKISELAKQGDKVVITVNGVGDGVFISMDTFNDYEQMQTSPFSMTKEERIEVTKILKERLAYAERADVRRFSHQEVGEMFGLKQS